MAPTPPRARPGLRLDLRELAVAELPETPGKHAIVPGNADGSELVRRIRATNVDERMPPASTHKTLSRAADGDPRAMDRERRRVSTALGVHRTRSARRAGTSRAPSARERNRSLRARTTRARRLAARRGSRQGNADQSRDADADGPAADARRGRRVRRRRGARRVRAARRSAARLAAPTPSTWPSYWLDLARFSETDGFLDDHHDRLLWPWRDWVIDSFARNRPFDEFATWQLAGDLLPNATREQILATAYLRVGKRTTENGAIDAEYKAEYMVERTDNALGVALLGLTVGCARCHDHKYDPIKQTDYYSLGAFFNSNDEPGAYAPGFSGIQGGPTLPWPDEATAAALRAAAAEVAAKTEPTPPRGPQRRRARAAKRDTAGGSPADAAARIRSALADALAAHYEFESARPAQLEDLPPPRPRAHSARGLTEFRRNPFSGPPPPAEPRRPSSAGSAKRCELAARVPRNYNAESLTLSPAATPGVAPAVIQGPLFRAGVRGQALFFDETNRGFLGADVGYYDREQPFTHRLLVLRRRGRTTTCPSSIISPSRTPAARVIGSRSRTASSGRRSRTRRRRT